MRGKISYYNEKTETGTVVDKARMVYEFKRSIWFDQHRLPECDMYVDFKVNERGNVERISESNFVKLQRKYDVNESDFWKSEDEEALEDIAVSRRESLINDGVFSISPKPIVEDYSIEDCFLAFFADPVELIYKYEDTVFSEKIESEKIDYFKLKKFMHKAKLQLIQTDGTISVDPFSKMEKELLGLEVIFSDVLKQKTKDAQTLFDEIYLSQQIGYLRMEKRVKLDAQKAFELNSLIKSANADIAVRQGRLNNEKDASNIASMQSKIAKLLEDQNTSTKELQTIEKNKKLFNEHLQNFKDKKHREFVENFGFETELKGVIDAVKTIIDHIAYEYDVLLWQKAVNSHIVRNTFYKQATEGNFCSVTFLRYYLRPLNKSALSKADETLYRYLMKYDKQYVKHVLVLSENRDKVESLTLEIYGRHKDSVVHQFLRAVDSLHWIRESKAAIALFDEQNRTLSPEELATNYAEAHPNEPFGIVVFNAKTSGTTKATDSIEIMRTTKSYDSQELAQRIEDSLST